MAFRRTTQFSVYIGSVYNFKTITYILIIVILYFQIRYMFKKINISGKRFWKNVKNKP